MAAVPNRETRLGHSCIQSALRAASSVSRENGRRLPSPAFGFVPFYLEKKPTSGRSRAFPYHKRAFKQNLAVREIKHNVASWPLYA